MEYTIKELAKKWKVSLRTARRRVEEAGYKTTKRIIDVTQKQEVLFIEIDG